MALSEREQRLVKITAVIGFIGILAIGWGLINKQSSGSVSESTVMKLDSLFEKMDSLEEQKLKNRMLKKQLGSANREFIHVSDLTVLLAELEQVAQQSGGVKIKGYNTNIDNRSQPLSKLEIKINFESKFESLIKFLTKMREAKYILQPLSMRMSLKDKKRPDLEVQMELVTYLLDKKPKQNNPTALVSRGEQ
ncbi:hypothetical protein GF373_03055 [bacterium]|nr:hypothetical protein [bacterium]